MRKFISHIYILYELHFKQESSSSKPIIENKEKKNWNIMISLTRHGRKEGHDGPLSEQGKIEAADYFFRNYKNALINNDSKRRIFVTHKDRTKQTADIYQNSLKENVGVEPVKTELSDNFFGNEGAIEGFIESLEGKERKNWFKHWVESGENLPTGMSSIKRVAGNFSIWFLKEIDIIKNKGGSSDIDSFSHGEIISAILYCIMEEIGDEAFFGLKNEEEKNKIINIIKNNRIELLQNINLSISSKDPNTVKLFAFGKNISVPIKIFEKFANEK